MFFRGGNLLDDPNLYVRVNCHVDDSNCRVGEQFICRGIYFWNSMVARCLLSLCFIFVGYADYFEAGFLVSRQMGVINDSACADERDSVVKPARQFRLVVEMREYICH